MGGGISLLARWTTDYDCGYETSWWYVIKDTFFDVEKLKAKRRYEITKGKRNFDVKRINAIEYTEELLNIQIAALAEWPEKYRPRINKTLFRESIKGWNEAIVYGAFDRADGRLCAYSYLKEYTGYLEFSVLRVRPESEKKGINAAVVTKIIEDYNDRLGRDFYINDGSRSVVHETAFQDYLEKYFGFRKAYCKLRIVYRFPMGIIVKLLYPFRNRIGSWGKGSSRLSAILKMEEIRRNQINESLKRRQE